MSIKVFVSTRETQGQRDNDFCFVPEGEIVNLKGITCSGEMTDGHCGCKRSLYGINCLKSTTTMKVASFDGGIADLAKLIEGSLTKGGWREPRKEMLDPEILGQASRIAEKASKFPVGTIVEYRDEVFAARQKGVL